MVRVQTVDLPAGGRTWTVLGEDHLPVEVVEEFLEHHRVVGSSPNTVRAYAKALQLWWVFLHLAGVGWADPGVSTLAGFVTWLRTGELPRVPVLGSRPASAALAESTVAVRLAAVVSFYRYQQDAHGRGGALARASAGAAGSGRYRPFLAHLPSAARRSPVRLRRARQVRPPLLSPAQVNAILSGCAVRDPQSGVWSGSLRNRLLFSVLAETGMRLGEALCLTHADWHTGRGGTPFVEVLPRVHPHGCRVKGGRCRRIYVSDALERLYSDYLWELADRAAGFGRAVADDWFCFVNLDGEPRFAAIRPEGVYRVVARLTRSCPQLPAGWTPHWLRHCHATALLLAGVPPHVVMRRLGHADIQTTLNLYGWVTEDAELRAVADWQRFAEGWRLSDG